MYPLWLLTKIKDCEVYNCNDRDLNGAKIFMNQCKYKLMLQKNKNLHYGL